MKSDRRKSLQEKKYVLASIAFWGHAAPKHSLLGGTLPLIPRAECAEFELLERVRFLKMRPIEIKVRLTKREADKLNERVQKSGLSRENYVRQLLNGLVPTDAPTPDYHAFMKELHAIGNNLNQIAQKAHSMGVIDVNHYEQHAAALNRAIVEITKAVMLPRKIEKA